MARAMPSFFFIMFLMYRCRNESVKSKLWNVTVSLIYNGWNDNLYEGGPSMILKMILGLVLGGVAGFGLSFLTRSVGSS